MKNLLRLELRKMRKQKSFYICMVIMAGLLFLSVLMSNILAKSPELAELFNVSAEDTVIEASDSSSFILIAGIFAALCVCDDYEQQTIKNIYAKGYSRNQVYFSKLISVWLGTTIMFAVILICAFLLGTAYFGAIDFGNPRLWGILSVQYAACMANIGLCFFLSFLLRKNGSAIAATIVVPVIVSLLLGVLDSFLKLEDFSLTDLWVSSFTGYLSSLSVSGEKLTVCLIGSLIYIVIFSVAGSLFQKKIEL